MTKSKRNISQYLSQCDIPLITFGGLALGFLIPGLIYMTLGAVFESDKNQICNMKSLLAGSCSVLISVLIIGIMVLYWKLILTKRGILYPSLTGFGLLTAVLSLFSAALLSAELCAWIIYRL